MLTDFIEQNSLDPEVIIDYADNYYQFLLKMKEDAYSFTAYESTVLTMISKEFINGKRIHELILIELLLNQNAVTREQYIEALKQADTYYDEDTIKSVENIFSLSFHVQNDFKKFGEKPLITFDSTQHQFNDAIQESLQNADFKLFIKDIIKCGYMKNKAYDRSTPLTLYKKYSRRDVCRLLNWEKDSSSTIYGYRTKYNTTPLFVTYHKKDEVETSQAYGDEFLSPDLFRWFTRNRLTLESNEVKAVLNHKEIGNDIYLFVKKDDGEGTDFYYLGTTDVLMETAKNESMPDKNGKQLPVVTMNMVLEQPVQYDIYHYLVEE